MNKYHVNPETGKAGKCSSDSSNPNTRGCDFSKNGVEVEHYETQEESERAYEKKAEEKFGLLSSVKKKPLLARSKYRVIQVDEDSLIPKEKLNTNHGDDETVTYYKEIYDHFEDVPRVVSRTRVVYFFGDHVIKVPLTDEGEYANSIEVNASKNNYVPIAKSEYMSIEIKGTVYEVMKMDKVTPIIAKYEDMPDWVQTVDCGQVGFTREGELVAYDL